MQNTQCVLPFPANMFIWLSSEKQILGCATQIIMMMQERPKVRLLYKPQHLQGSWKNSNGSKRKNRMMKLLVKLQTNQKSHKLVISIQLTYAHVRSLNTMYAQSYPEAISQGPSGGPEVTGRFLSGLLLNESFSLFILF